MDDSKAEGKETELPMMPHPFGELVPGAGPKDRILHATAMLIERLGIEKLTTRSIAAEARVNLALVNYYFHGKSELVRSALSMGLGNMLADAARLFEKPWPSKSECHTAILEYLIGGSMYFPRITAAILHCPAEYLDIGSSPAERMGAIILEATRDMAEELGFRDEEAIAMRAALVASSVVFPIIEPALFGVGMGIDPALTSLRDRAAQAVYAARLTADSVAIFERER